MHSKGNWERIRHLDLGNRVSLCLNFDGSEKESKDEKILCIVSHIAPRVIIGFLEEAEISISMNNLVVNKSENKTVEHEWRLRTITANCSGEKSSLGE